MKTVKNLFFFILIILLFNNASCEKPIIEPPTGDNTFYCYINGELFVPKSCVSCVPFYQGYSMLEYDNYFTSRAYDQKKYTVYFTIINWEVGTFNLQDSNGLMAPEDHNDINHAIIIKNGIKYLSKQGSGIVNFTVKTETDIKGTFEFTLYNEDNPNDMIQVTNGHFDN